MPTDEREILIEAKEVSFSYRESEPILKSVSLTVYRGDFFGLIGPNGSGKSTLLKVLVGVFPPTSGEVKFFGEDPRKSNKRVNIGYVSQRATQFDRNFPATVLEVVQMGRVARAGLFTRLTHEDREKSLAALREVGMEAQASKRIGELSFGQQQRVIIARALAGEPDLIIMDEPTVGVDVNAEAEFYKMVRRLNTEKKITLIVSTHDLDIIGHEVNKLMCLHCSIATHGTPQQFLEGETLHHAAQNGIQLIPHHESTHEHRNNT